MSSVLQYIETWLKVRYGLFQPCVIKTCLFYITFFPLKLKVYTQNYQNKHCEGEIHNFCFPSSCEQLLFTTLPNEFFRVCPNLLYHA